MHHIIALFNLFLLNNVRIFFISKLTHPPHRTVCFVKWLVHVNLHKRIPEIKVPIKRDSISITACCNDMRISADSVLINVCIVHITCEYVTYSTRNVSCQHIFTCLNVSTSWKPEHARLRYVTCLARRVRRVRVYTCLACVNTCSIYKFNKIQIR
jgi:hypothetical protein